MKSTLPAQHLLRQYLLFIVTVICLLTTARAGYALWQYALLEETGAFVALFVQGLRFDLALVGVLCLVPVVLGGLLSMFGATRAVARYLISFCLFVSLLLILVAEIVTPWFIQTYGMRPDISLLQQSADVPGAPLGTIRDVLMEHTIETVVAIVVGLLILIAFWARMELPRFLRYRLSIPAALVTVLSGGILCLMAIWSTPDPRKAALGPNDALISDNATVNDLAMNSTYKTLHSIALPYLNRE